MLGINKLITAIVLLASILNTGSAFARSSQSLMDKSIKQQESMRSSSLMGVDSVSDPALNWPLIYGVQQTGVINASFDSKGMFGLDYYDYPLMPEWPINNFETPAYSGKDYLFTAAVWVGGIVNGDTLVSTGADGWMGGYEYSPPANAGAGVTKLEGMADYSMRAIFNDNSGVRYSYHVPLNISIANRSHVWRSAPYNNSVIYDMVITNIGEDQITEGYVGIYVDGDVLFGNDYDGYTDDLAGSLPGEGIGYIIDNDGEPRTTGWDESTSLQKIIAFKFLSSSFEATDKSYHWWISNSAAALDFGPRKKKDTRDFGTGGSGTPEGDANKYFLLSSNDWDYDQCLTASIDSLDPVWQYPNPDISTNFSNGYDARFLMSLGPFDLAPDSSIRIQYTMFTADSIHIDPYNLFNLNYNSYDPVTYLDNLNLDNLFPNALAAGMKAFRLLNPLMPATGLALQRWGTDSLYLEWDDWSYPTIDGYNLYLTEIDLATLPHPGLIPPWWNTDSPDFQTAVGRVHEYRVEVLDTTIAYIAHVAHRTPGGNGSLSRPLIVNPYPGGIPSPEIEMETVFCSLGGGITTISWLPAVIDIDHYNIYQFISEVDLETAYLPYYSVEDLSDDTTDARVPVDTIDVNGIFYYYYAMAVDQVVNAGSTSLQVSAIDRDMFLITAVDQNGFESAFSIPITALEVSEPTKDVYVLVYDSVDVETYNDLLSCMDLQYDIIIRNDCSDLFCPSLGVLSAYKVVILDSEVRYLNDNRNYFYEFIISGGSLAIFSEDDLFRSYGMELNWAFPTIKDYPLSNYIDIDSGLTPTIFYYLYLNEGLPIPESDTLFGFSWAETQTSQFPSLHGDPQKYFATEYWPLDAPFNISVFAPGPNSEVTHLLRALYPEKSLFEGLPVGIKTTVDDIYGHHETYTFGFSLSNIQEPEARKMIRDLLGLKPCCGQYTNGYTGNTTFDIEGLRDLTDIIQLIDRIFLTKAPLCCEENGNVSGDAEALIDLVDINRLIDHIYLTKAETAPCE